MNEVRTPTRYPHRLTIRILLILGATTLLGAAFTAEPDIGFFLRATRTEGRFIGAIQQSGSNHGVQFYHPMFRYSTSDGSIRTFTAKGGSTSQPYADGAKVAVYYDPDHPETARLNSFIGVWLQPIVMALAGALLLGIGLVLRRTFGAKAA